MKFWGGALLLLLSACAAERPYKPLIGNPARLAKGTLGGDFYFLKSVVEVKAPGKQFSSVLPGSYLKTNNLVRFQIKERTIEVINQVRALQNDRPAEKNPVLATFACRNVDVLRKQNLDGIDTHEEEETETRRVWNERGHVVFDGAQDAQDEFIKDTVSAQMENVLLEEGSIRFDVVRQLNDGTLVRERYHFLAKRPSTYSARVYPMAMQMRFGFFRTTQPGFDTYLQPSQLENQDWMNRRSLGSPVRYFVDPGFPEHLKGGVRSALEQWNLAFKQATEKSPLEPVFEATAEKRGDLRFNVIVYDDAIDAGHGILGYAPTFSDPTTGELINGSVYVYGGTLAWARLAEESWRRTKNPPAPPIVSVDSSVGSKPPTESEALIQYLKPFRALALNEPRLENEALAEQVRKVAQPERLLENSRAAFLGEQRERLTQWDAAAPLINLNHAENPVALEQKIFPPLIAHEIGHTLGLRHNFKGSADQRHITRGKSSTVMDYGFLASEESHEIGQYDYAAIEIGYGNRKSEQVRLRNENFFYCSDEHVYNSKDGICLPYDTGRTLTEILDSLYRRYVGSYHFLNLRLDRLYFDESMDNYLRKVGTLLLPIRQIYDHASAILAESQAKNYVGLWRLTGARIEKDFAGAVDENPPLASAVDMGKESKAKVPGKELTTSNIPQIDAAKLEQVVNDAREAKKLAVSILFQIVFKKDVLAVGNPLQRLMANRFDVDQFDDAKTLWVRGVLADRLMALSLLTSASPDPVGNVTTRSIATTYSQGLPALDADAFVAQLSSVLSNSVIDSDLVGSRVMPLNPPLPNAIRRSAQKWTAQDLGFFSEGNLVPLLRIDKFALPLPVFGLNETNFFDTLAKLPKMEDLKAFDRLLTGQKATLSNLAEILRGRALERDKEKQTLKDLLEIEDLMTKQAESVSVPTNQGKDLLRVYRNKRGPSPLLMHAISHLYRADLYRQAFEKAAESALAEVKLEETKEEFAQDRVSVAQWKNQAAEATKSAEDLERFLYAERALMESAYGYFKGKTAE